MEVKIICAQKNITFCFAKSVVDQITNWLNWLFNFIRIVIWKRKLPGCLFCSQIITLKKKKTIKFVPSHLVFVLSDVMKRQFFSSIKITAWFKEYHWFSFLLNETNLMSLTNLRLSSELVLVLWSCRYLALSFIVI